jgi:hypothetical protein
MIPIKLKLEYEWKNIYRDVRMLDTANEGIVKISDFEKVLLNHSVKITRDDLNKIILSSNSTKQGLNYELAAMALGLPMKFALKHSQTASYINKVHEKRSRAGPLNK